MKFELKHLWGLVLLLVVACGGGDDNPPTPTPTPDPDPVDDFELDLSTCPLSVSNESLEILTWNLEQFPKDEMTAEILKEVIETYNADVIAVQEIRNLDAFNDLIAALDGWDGVATQYNGSNLMLGYLYKTTEVTVNGSATELYEEDTDANNTAFTSYRRPLMLSVTHNVTGLQTYLINIHLKCCDGSEDRRRAATDLIKSYIDTELPSDNVVVLGDYNDEIVDGDNVFQAFIDDADNYVFTTMEIAQGANTEWSFPNWPSMIDHILITNELFEYELESAVLTLDRCFDDFDQYDEKLSDHRPVYIRLGEK